MNVTDVINQWSCASSLLSYLPSYSTDREGRRGEESEDKGRGGTGEEGDKDGKREGVRKRGAVRKTEGAEGGGGGKKGPRKEGRTETPTARNECGWRETRAEGERERRRQDRGPR
jgi:hypothetical protein